MKHLMEDVYPPNPEGYPTDEEISEALTGDEKDIDRALENIYKVYGRVLYALAKAITRSAEDAEDAVQLTVLAVFEKARDRTWRTGKPLTHFLKSTVRNKSIDIIRKRMPALRLADMLQEEEAARPQVLRSAVPRRILEEEGKVNYEKFLASLTPEEKPVAKYIGAYWLKCGCRPTVQEILDEMHRLGKTNAKVTSVKSTLRWVWRKMRKWFED